MTRSDIIIIGSGPGGYRAACHAATKGLSVVIIEEAEVGGTCLNCGCIPTKTFCRNAEIIDTLHKADEFGLSGLSYNLDFAKITERKEGVVSQLRSGVEALLSQKNITLVRGRASFVDKSTIVVGDELYVADNIIIATGSHAALPPISGTELLGVVTSTELLNVKDVPHRLCIIGAGVIGMEFASAFSSFGSEVIVIEFLKEALPVLDGDIAKRLRQVLARRGVVFFMQSCVKSIEETCNNECKQLAVTFERKGKETHVEADMVLIATGRAANTSGLNLESVGIDYNRKGICVDENFQTNIKGIYAIGDVNGKCMLAHAATFQGLHVVNYIAGAKDNIRHEIMPSAVFTNPEAASVGKSEDMCKAEGIQYVCRKGFFRSNGKALAIGETEGMIKLITMPDGKILGCHCFGPHASDIVQEVAVLMNNDSTVSHLADMIHIHPTLAEVLHDISL